MYNTIKHFVKKIINKRSWVIGDGVERLTALNTKHDGSDELLIINLASHCVWKKPVGSAGLQHLLKCRLTTAIYPPAVKLVTQNRQKSKLGKQNDEFKHRSDDPLVEHRGHVLHWICKTFCWLLSQKLALSQVQCSVNQASSQQVCSWRSEKQQNAPLVEPHCCDGSRQYAWRFFIHLINLRVVLPQFDSFINPAKVYFCGHFLSKNLTCARANICLPTLSFGGFDVFF